ncbi:MAG: ABC transporter permease [Oscillospiraceae bacterium]|jgi:peptide/nickel transport system permease protein|nr:ABC transporter permease [Oscillospiraceae bacterium]
MSTASLVKKTVLDRRMDKIRALEESGKLATKLTNRTLRKVLSNKLAVLGAVLFVVICILCFAAPLFTQWGPTQISLRDRITSPNAQHIFGTDQMGRDIWARMLYGGRISIIVGLGSALGAAVIGVTLGMYVGYKGKWLDAIILKISDVFLAFPQMVLIIIMVALVGQSLQNMIIIFILTGWPSMYRMARSKVLSLKEEEFVQALRAFGISDVKIAFKHMLPNTIGPIVVNITLSTAMFILQEASLSVLGYGVPQEVATWGNIINVITNAGTIRYDWLGYWWMWLPCAIMLILFVLAINFIGDGLRDASDPTQIG